MNTELIGKWISALRSGKYQQVRGAMRSSGYVTGHCCLGVLCDIIDTDAWEKDSWQEEANYPPASVMDDVEIGMPTMRNLARMNDSGYSFLEIASFIEKYILTDGRISPPWRIALKAQNEKLSADNIYNMDKQIAWMNEHLVPSEQLLDLVKKIKYKEEEELEKELVCV